MPWCVSGCKITRTRPVFDYSCFVTMKRHFHNAVKWDTVYLSPVLVMLIPDCSLSCTIPHHGLLYVIGIDSVKSLQAKPSLLLQPAADCRHSV